MALTFAAFCEKTGLKRELLVIAPHPDDETIGCGGLLALACEAGLSCTVVVVTDGGASHPRSRAWPRERLIRQRRLEVNRALRILGVTRDALFLDLPDAQTLELPRAITIQAQSRLQDLMQSLTPDIVLTTWRREPHCDHRFAYDVTKAALEAAGGSTGLYEYMVWTAFHGEAGDWPRPDETTSISLDIVGAQARKMRALYAHKSQIGKLIDDDPSGFRLSTEQINQMIGITEKFYHAP
jgi:LmbE family N-acetylglucosaminyl deacetylase